MKKTNATRQQMNQNRINLFDAMGLLKSLPDNSVDIVFTDPPYSQEAHGRGGDINKKRKLFKDMAAWTNTGNEFYSDAWLDEYMRVCKIPNIVLFCNEQELCGLLVYAKSHGLKSTRIIPILKETPVPFTNQNWLQNEFLIHLCDRRLGYNSDYHCKIPYFMFSGGVSGETSHPNEKPVMVCRKVLQNCSRENDVVLDPFAGSGSIPCACVLEKRRFIAGEINQKFVDAANTRLDEYSRVLTLF